MYRLAIAKDFIARHYLIGADWGPENTEHSHHYKAEIVLDGEVLDGHGYLVDIVDLKAALDAVVGQFRDHLLNDVEPFHGINPSIERFSRIIWEMLTARLNLAGQTLTVNIWETETEWAGYSRKVGAE